VIRLDPAVHQFIDANAGELPDVVAVPEPLPYMRPLIDLRRRSPTRSLRHHHHYPAARHRGLRVDRRRSTAEFPATSDAWTVSARGAAQLDGLFRTPCVCC